MLEAVKRFQPTKYALSDPFFWQTAHFLMTKKQIFSKINEVRPRVGRPVVRQTTFAVIFLHSECIFCDETHEGKDTQSRLCYKNPKEPGGQAFSEA